MVFDMGFKYWFWSTLFRFYPVNPSSMRWWWILGKLVDSAQDRFTQAYAAVMGRIDELVREDDL